MHDEHHQAEKANQKRIGIQQGKERDAECSIGVDGQPAYYVADRHAVEDCGHQAAQAERPVPKPPPSGVVNLSAELYRDGAEDQSAQQKHEGEI